MLSKFTINPILFFALISSAFCLKIDKCWTEQRITFRDEKLQDATLDGYIDADLDLNRINNIAFINNITFNGQVWFQDEPITDLSVKFPSIKLVRIQRIIEYDNNGLVDVVRSQCNLGFIINYSTRMGVRYVVENQILQHTEYCIKKAICNFDVESHKIGDNFAVKSMTRQQSWHFTSQETVNGATDVLVNKLINGLIAANKSVFYIPEFETTFYLALSFKSSGGPVDILKNIQRVDDFQFLYEGHKYIMGTTLNLTGGVIELNDVYFSALLFLNINGKLSVDMTGTRLHIKVAFDYNTSPCKVSVDAIKMTVPTEAVDFSKLQFGFASIETLLSYIHGKSTLINFLTGKVEDLIKNAIEGLKCEDYRHSLFGDWTKKE